MTNCGNMKGIRCRESAWKCLGLEGSRGSRRSRRSFCISGAGFALAREKGPSFGGNAIATGEVGCDGSGEQSLQACGNLFGPQRPPAGLLSSGWPEAVGSSSPSYLSSYVRTYSLDQTSSRDRIGPGPEMIC